jgi:hypothetical protein
MKTDRVNYKYHLVHVLYCNIGVSENYKTDTQAHYVRNMQSALTLQHTAHMVTTGLCTIKCCLCLEHTTWTSETIQILANLKREKSNADNTDGELYWK